MLPRCELLANGMRAVLVPCEAESVAVGVFTTSGSRCETAKTAGISHFIEHMLFKGTPTRKPVDIIRAIEGRGGNFNACTSEEGTCYYAHLPCEYLGEAVDILSDMYLNATIPDDEFEREKQVIIEEIRMYDDDPDSVAMEKLQRSLFPKSQLGASVAGTPESLKPMRPQDLRNYMATHYQPHNTVIVVVGNFEDARAISELQKTFGRLRRRNRPLRTDDANAGRPVPEVRVQKEICQTHLALGFRTFGIGDSRKYALTILDAILGRGMSSRLFQEVREKRGLSYDIASHMQFFRDAGMLAITAGLDQNKAGETMKTIDRELKRIREKAVGATEMRRTKDFLVGNFRLAHERVISKMFFYGQTMQSFGRLVTPEEQVEGLRKVTAAEVKSVANAILRDDNRSVSWVEPKVKGK